MVHLFFRTLGLTIIDKWSSTSTQHSQQCQGSLRRVLVQRLAAVDLRPSKISPGF